MFKYKTPPKNTITNKESKVLTYLASCYILQHNTFITVSTLQVRYMYLSVHTTYPGHVRSKNAHTHTYNHTHTKDSPLTEHHITDIYPG